jgi:hypothetical protein
MAEVNFQRFDLEKFPNKTDREAGSFDFAQAVSRPKIIFARRHHRS